MTRTPPPWILALLGVVLLFVLAALVSAKAVAQAWLAGFIVVSNFPVGAVVLLMIGRLTGGRWVEVFGPELRRLAAWTPWLFLFAAPFLIAPQFVFPWAETPEKTPDLLKLYFSPGLFAVRTLLALALWSGFGLAFSRGRPGPAMAGIGLTLHGLMLVLIPNDWILSFQPGWTTSNIAMIGAAMQILSACALILILTRGPAGAGLGRPRRLRRRHGPGARLPRLHGLPGRLVRRHPEPVRLLPRPPGRALDLRAPARGRARRRVALRHGHGRTPLWARKVRLGGPGGHGGRTRLPGLVARPEPRPGGLRHRRARDRRPARLAARPARLARKRARSGGPAMPEVAPSHGHEGWGAREHAGYALAAALYALAFVGCGVAAVLFALYFPGHHARPWPQPVPRAASERAHRPGSAVQLRAETRSGLRRRAGDARRWRRKGTRAGGRRAVPPPPAQGPRP